MFKDRADGGRKLARALIGLKGAPIIVYALPRGGVVTGAVVAKYLNAPLDLLLPRKIGHPAMPEYAIGAVTETGTPIWEQSGLDVTEERWRYHQIAHARQEARRRRIQYLDGRHTQDSIGKIALLVDDGIATGLTMIAALGDLPTLEPASVIVASPIGPAGAMEKLQRLADEVVILNIPNGYFGAIGAYYTQFPQVEDEQVRGLLNAYRNAPKSETLDLPALNSILSTITKYPVTSGEVAARARNLHSPANVVHFFESIPRDVLFQDKMDIMRRSEEVDLLMQDESNEPEERLSSYDS